MRKKSLIFLVFIVSLFAVQNYGIAKGAILRDVIYGMENTGQPDTKVCYHSSGRIIYTIRLGVDLIHTRIYTSLGTFLGSVNVTETGTDKFLDVSVSELDDDEVLLYIVMRRQGATDYFFGVVYRINVISYSASSQYSVQLWSVGSAGAGTGGAIGHMFNYTGDGLFYGVGQLTWNTPSGQGYYFGCSFNPSTNTVALTFFERSTQDTFHNIYDFYDLDTAGHEALIYFVSSSMTDDTPQYYTYDMSSGILTLLTNHPVGSVFPYADRRLNYLGGGLYYNSSADETWIWFTWEWSYTTASVRFVRVEQGRSAYNGTVVSNTTLLGSCRTGAVIFPNLGSGSDAFSFGYAPARDSVIVYYAEIYEGDYNIAEWNGSISDWFSYSPYTSSWSATITHESDVDVVYHLITDYIFTTPIGTLEFNEYSGNTYVYQMSALMRVYDITVSYVPAHDPLQVDTNYVFTITTYLNLVPASLKVQVYWNGAFRFADTTHVTTGDIDTSISTSLQGLHTLTVYLYDWENELVRTESFNYLFTGEAPTGDITPEDTSFITLNTLMTALPSIVITLFPSIMFLTIERSPIMLVVGLTVGAVIGVLAGLLPLYVLFVFIICDLMILFISRRVEG